jgi:hypothetical protein
VVAAAIAWGPSAVAQKPPESLQMGGKKSVTRFFITSRGLGRGGNLGGLAGADAHCQALAKAEGSGDHTWHAYLSTMATSTAPAVNARDRIGKGPWYNALGDRIAIDVQRLHTDGGNKINVENAVTERGEMVKLEDHDILTGSRPDGTSYPGTGDVTCSNWTSSSSGRAQVGHFDRMGKDARERSWNSAHATRGCSQQDFRATGGAGLFYCFALD